MSGDSRKHFKKFILKDFKMKRETFYLFLLLAVLMYGKSAASIPNETWNYVTIRQDAHMF